MVLANTGAAASLLAEILCHTHSWPKHIVQRAEEWPESKNELELGKEISGIVSFPSIRPFRNTIFPLSLEVDPHFWSGWRLLCFLLPVVRLTARRLMIQVHPKRPEGHGWACEKPKTVFDKQHTVLYDEPVISDWKCMNVTSYFGVHDFLHLNWASFHHTLLFHQGWCYL